MDGRKTKGAKPRIPRDAALAALVAAAGVAFAPACSAPEYDGSTIEGKAAILDSVNRALSSGDCTTAVAAIEPLYGSVNSDNEVRIARASAQGCAAGLSNFLTMLSDIVGSVSSLGPKLFWRKTTELFYNSTAVTLDTQITATWNATDALMAVLKPGVVIATANQVAPGGFNPGSAVISDRTTDANFYLVFIAMASMGKLQGRYGAPNTSTWLRGAAAPRIGSTSAADTVGWTREDKVDEFACSYAAAVLNVMDTMNDTISQTSGSLNSALQKVLDTFSSQINLACETGCTTGGVLNTVTYTTGADCTFASSLCTGSTGRPCVSFLRNRGACTENTTSTNDDIARCAAASIANYVSQDPVGWVE